MTLALTVETLYYRECYPEAHMCNHVHTPNYMSFLQKSPIKETLFTQADKVSRCMLLYETTMELRTMKAEVRTIE